MEIWNSARAADTGHAAAMAAAHVSKTGRQRMPSPLRIIASAPSMGMILRFELFPRRRGASKGFDSWGSAQLNLIGDSG
jgi:hypothetical protein